MASLEAPVCPTYVPRVALLKEKHSGRTARSSGVGASWEATEAANSAADTLWVDFS